MNTIEKKQNEKEQLERLAAQREVYSSAKRWHIFQIILTVIVPVILSIITLINRDFAVYGALVGIGIFIFDLTFLELVIKKLKLKGAKIQESFDCYVLDLPPSPMKTIDSIQIEEVLRYHKAYIKIKTNEEKIRDWYPGSQIAMLPIHIARIICQRANCYWDSNQRQRYAKTVRAIGYGILLIIIITAIIRRLDLIEIALVAAGLVPFFKLCIKHCTENFDSAKRLEDLVKYSGKIWSKALSKKYSEEQITDDSRRLQDEIYEHRTKAPLVFDKFYNTFRDADESIMNVSSDRLSEEAKKVLKIV